MTTINELSKTTVLESADIVPVWKKEIGDTRGATFGTVVDAVVASLPPLSGSGTVTSVALSVPTGLTVSGSPVTSSGTIVLSYSAGYSIPSDASQSNWNTAYSWGNHALAGYNLRSNHTGTQTASTISDFDASARAQIEGALAAGANITITPSGSGATRTFTIAAAGGAGATNLSYTAATRVIASDTGTDATLPLVSSSDAGLAPASGGGTTNFLRADGTWAEPPGGGGGVTDGDKGDITVSGSGATWTVDNGSITLAKMANIATSSIVGRATAGTGVPEALSATQVRTILNVADGATANSSDASLRDRSTHTGTQTASTISDFASAVAATAAVTANTAKVTNATHTGEVTGSGALTITAGAVTNAKLANVATATIKGRATAGTGSPEDLTAAQVRTLINVADGATANSSDATLLDRANHTGTQAQSTVTNLVSDLAAKAPLASPTFTGTVTLPAGQVVNGVTLSTAAGTSVYLRGDGTYATPAGGGGGALDDLTDVTITTPTTGQVLKYNGTAWVNDTDATGAGSLSDGDKGDITVSASGATWTIDNSAVTNAKVASGIDAVKIADGSVSNTEFQYLNGVTSAIQTQIDSKLASDVATAITLTNPTPADGDQIITIDISDSNIPKLTTKAELLAGLISTPVIPDLAPLGNWDFWYYWAAGVTTASASDMFAGAAISSGTNTTAIPSAALLGYNNYGIFLRSSTTANGGYRYQTSSQVADYFGTISHKFRCQFLWRTSFTGRTVRIGYHDTTTNADATDGAYFEILDATCSCKTANNSTRTTDATTLTLSLDTAYTFDIEVNAAGTSARFRVYSGTSATAALDVTITTNIPTTSARAFGAGIVATESSTTASDIGILYGIGIGTVEAFQTRDVAPLLGDIQAILESI